VLSDGIRSGSLSKSSMCALYKQFYGTGCLCKGNVPCAVKCMDGTGIRTVCVQSYQQCTYRTPLSGKINFEDASLMSESPNIVSCPIPSKHIPETVKYIYADP
jgi:hypothetical protein